jgi:hypothetical protein
LKPIEVELMMFHVEASDREGMAQARHRIALAVFQRFDDLGIEFQFSAPLPPAEGMPP